VIAYTQVMESTTAANELDRIRDYLDGQRDITLAVVFGSMASGEADTDSDIDLAVYCDAGALSATRKLELITAVAGMTGRPVDLVDLRNADVLIRREALTGGKRLVARNPHVHGDELSRMVIDAEDFLPYLERSMRQRRERWIG